MIRKAFLSAVVVLLLSSGAFADIGQTQSFEIGALNEVSVVGGFGKASGENHLEIGQRQKERYACLGSAAMKQEGVLTQEARAQARRGTVGIGQNASVDGSQNQLIGHGRRGSNEQQQGLNLSLSTTTSKPPGGVGRAIGSQSFVGEQSQKQTYRGGSSTSSQFVQAEQSVKIIGDRRSNIIVNSNLDVKMSQSNSVTGGPAPRHPSPAWDP